MRTCSSFLLPALTLLSAGGCEPPSNGWFVTSAVEPVGLTVERDASMPTSLWVSWETDEPGTSWVRYGVQGEQLSETAGLEDGQDHRVQILGLPPDASVTIEAHTLADGLEYEGEATATTGAVPSNLPIFHLKVPESPMAAPARFTLVPVRERDANWLVIIDRQGRPVWYLSGNSGQEFADAELDEEADDFVVLQQDWSTGEGTLWRVPLRSPSQAVQFPITDAHHALAALPGGVIGYIAQDRRPWSFEAGETLEVAGDAIWERSPDGSLVKVFSTWDWADPQLSPFMDGFGQDVEDWTHGNALTFRPETDSYLLSLRNPACILEIDRATGDVLAEYGGDGADWDFADGSEPFFYQHDARWTASGHLLMMSTPLREDGQQGWASVAIEYSLDEQRHELVEVWRHGDVDPIIARSHGGAIRLPNSNTLVNWGDPTGAIREVTAANQTTWEVRALSVEGGDVAVFGTVPFDGFYPTP